MADPIEFQYPYKKDAGEPTGWDTLKFLLLMATVLAALLYFR